MKSGIKTTEFLVTIFTIVGSAGAAIQGVLDPKWAAIAASVSGAAYALSRAIVKITGGK